MIRRSSMPKQLTGGQKKTMKKHSKHHTKKHMASMKKGKTFKQAHNKAMRKVGR